MQSHVPSRPETGAAAEAAVFDRIVVGIDSTDESLVAAAQAGVLRAPGGELVLLAALERHQATHAGLFAATAEDIILAGTSTELERARELVDADDAVLKLGSLVPSLCAECESRDALHLAGRDAGDHPPRYDRELAIRGIETDPPLRARDVSGERSGRGRPR
jgi:hypothetical protein